MTLRQKYQKAFENFLSNTEEVKTALEVSNETANQLFLRYSLVLFQDGSYQFCYGSKKVANGLLVPIPSSPEDEKVEDSIEVICSNFAYSVNDTRLLLALITPVEYRQTHLMTASQCLESAY